MLYPYTVEVLSQNCRLVSNVCCVYMYGRFIVCIQIRFAYISRMTGGNRSTLFMLVSTHLSCVQYSADEISHLLMFTSERCTIYKISAKITLHKSHVYSTALSHRCVLLHAVILVCSLHVLQTRDPSLSP